jgi:serine/threonine-protein kinase
MEPDDAGALAGTVHGRFRVDTLLGSGGLGEVYAATDTTTGERVALKTLLPGDRDSHEAIRRLEREGLAGGMLDHPNIVGVLALDFLVDGTPFLVMELVSGANVGALLRRGPLPPGHSLAITRQTLDGLAHAHALGVLHRDLKPENLMVAADGRVKILDLGIAKIIGAIADELGLAKLTETGTVIGTPAYMAPEQALGQPCTPATDLYAVGVILFEMVTGRPPFVAADALAMLRLQVTAPPPRLADAVLAPWCTPELAHVIDRALQKKADQRFASAEEMRAAVEAAARSIA